MEKILVVEDDLALSAGLCFELDAAGYAAVPAYNRKKAEYLIENDTFSLAVLDVNLPDGSGFDLCALIKERKADLPVIFLTANDLEEDILNGLDLGAEDYITKPFSTNVFIKKAGIILRRGKKVRAAKESAEGPDFDDGNLRLDFDSMTAERGSEKLNITPNEYKILKVLTANAGNIISRQTLLEKVYDCEENYIDDHTLTVNINRLRAKLEDEGHRYIKTIRGMGYAWTGRKK